MIETDLKTCLADHQRKLEKKKIVQQQKVTIVGSENEDHGIRLLNEDEQKQESNERIFNIKSLKVDWEDSPCFMHVFIDTTDIVKLEEAKNNIRCQKIMFTNLSHEFRTPLNAIINSYKLIEQTFKTFSSLLDSGREERK